MFVLELLALILKMTAANITKIASLHFIVYPTDAEAMKQALVPLPEPDLQHCISPRMLWALRLCAGAPVHGRSQKGAAHGHGPGAAGVSQARHSQLFSE